MILQEKRRKPERTIEKQELNIFKSLLLLFTRGSREILKEADVLQGRQERQDHKVSLGEPTFFRNVMVMTSMGRLLTPETYGKEKRGQTEQKNGRSEGRGPLTEV